MQLARQRLDIKVKVDVHEVIKALRNNKLKHIEEYNAAVDGFFDKLRAEVGKLADALNDRKLEQVQLYMAPPVDARGLYDEYIKMLELAQDDEIEISTEEYACLFEDKWDWAQSAKAANTAYSSYSG